MDSFVLTGFATSSTSATGSKPERFNIHLEHPKEFIDRHLRLPIRERIGPDGNVLVPMQEQDVRDAAHRFRENSVASVAVAFLWSVANSIHEERAAEILREECPEIHVVCSAHVLPEIREWERTSAAVLSAYILPSIDAYLRKLVGLFATAGAAREPLIMQVNGGCASVQEVLERPVYALASGPAAAPAAATFHTRSLGLNNLITCDMGGTSFDVCVVRDGRPALSRGLRVQEQPIGVAAVEVRSVGAGGGSIAWVDGGGALQVGPRSAGARPGPACYAAGGEEPTVTDANVVLGYLAPDAFLGGRRKLDVDAARDAIDRCIAGPLGLDVQRAAAGIIRVVNANMAGALRAVSIERGVDPRQFSLVAGGGAGGLHAGQLAAQLGMTTVVIPNEAGTFCAFGMTVTDVRHDFVRAYHALSTDIDSQRVEALFARLEEEGRARLAEAGFPVEQMLLERWVDARYPGQVHELTIPARGEGEAGVSNLGGLERDFHEAHAIRFTYSRPDMPVEFLHWRVVAIGRMPRADGTDLDL